mmetsp:Transcript_1002/g.1958  ORF Transcript_1002/g.1958 Transcript_1002/m.1958 type:complete len:112 (-) Transcript_1002:513-848(-)
MVFYKFAYSLGKLGTQLENPFGKDMNDLPLGSFTAEIMNNVVGIIHNSIYLFPQQDQYLEKSYTSKSSSKLSKEVAGKDAARPLPQAPVPYDPRTKLAPLTASPKSPFGPN